MFEPRLFYYNKNSQKIVEDEAFYYHSNYEMEDIEELKKLCRKLLEEKVKNSYDSVVSYMLIQDVETLDFIDIVAFEKTGEITDEIQLKKLLA